MKYSTLLAASIFLVATAFLKAQVTTASAPELPKIPDKSFLLSDYGAVGDGKTMNTDAFQKALDAVSQGGGGTLTIPAGRFLTGPLVLISSLNLYLAKGAVLLISNDLTTYPSD